MKSAHTITLSIIEFITGIAAFVIIDLKLGFWLAFAVFLLMWSNNCQRRLAILRP